VTLRRISATRYVTPLREGGSLPAIVEADDDGLYVLKFRGAGQGRKAATPEPGHARKPFPAIREHVLLPFAGSIAALDTTARFHWLVAPSSTIIQPSAVHTGVCGEPATELDKLFAALVERPA
jgi:hypothetical protein